MTTVRSETKLETKDSALEPLIKEWNIPNPTHLWFAGKPATPGQVVDAKLTPLNEVEAILGIKWTEMVIGESGLNNKLLPHCEAAATNKFKQISYNEYVTRLKELHDNCVIRWLNDDIGWVLTVRKGGKLSKGFIGTYTGKATFATKEAESDVTFMEYSAFIFSDEAGLGVVDARNCGNLLRLAPCLMDKQEIVDNFKLDSSIQNNVASANLYLNGAIINGKLAPFLFAIEDIHAKNNEVLLGYNYSLHYINSMRSQNKTFRLFNSETLQPIDTALCPLKYIKVQGEVEGIKYEFSLPRLRLAQEADTPSNDAIVYVAEDKDGKGHQLVFSNKDMFEALYRQDFAPQIMATALRGRIHPLMYQQLMMTKKPQTDTITLTPTASLRLTDDEFAKIKGFKKPADSKEEQKPTVPAEKSHVGTQGLFASKEDKNTEVGVGSANKNTSSIVQKDRCNIM